MTFILYNMALMTMKLLFFYLALQKLLHDTVDIFFFFQMMSPLGF